MDFSMFFQVAGAFAGSLTFSVLLEVPRKYLVPAGAAGAGGYFIYLLFEGRYGVLTATLAASLFIALLSHSFARIYKAPVVLFLIPGVITLVPGAGMYRTVYEIMLGTKSEAVTYFQQTLQTAGMIALGIFIMDSVVRLVFPRKTFLDSERKEGE